MLMNDVCLRMWIESVLEEGLFVFPRCPIVIKRTVIISKTYVWSFLYYIFSMF